MCPAGSSRWSPTTEQLMILEELYRSGIRTPSASQIQQITTHLSFYGRIEGKNVFYWFQNHKARDRQKLRRKLNKQLQLQQQQQQQQQQLQVHQYHHHCQLNNQDMMISSNHFVGGFGCCPPAGFTTQQEISFYNSASLLFEGGAGNTSSQGGINCKWNNACNYNPQSLVEKKKEINAFCNYGWTTLVDVNNQASSCCTTRPLKTLDLFSLTTTRSIKEDCTTSSPNSIISSSIFPCSSTKTQNSM